MPDINRVEKHPGDSVPKVVPEFLGMMAHADVPILRDRGSNEKGGWLNCPQNGGVREILLANSVVFNMAPRVPDTWERHFTQIPRIDFLVTSLWVPSRRRVYQSLVHTFEELADRISHYQISNRIQWSRFAIDNHQFGTTRFCQSREVGGWRDDQ